MGAGATRSSTCSARRAQLRMMAEKDDKAIEATTKAKRGAKLPVAKGKKARRKPKMGDEGPAPGEGFCEIRRAASGCWWRTCRRTRGGH